MRLSVILVLIVVLLGLSPARLEGGSSPAYNLSPQVLASGGQTASSSRYSVVSTLGQPLIGRSNSANYRVDNGFWSRIESIFRLFLPVAAKGY